MGSIGKRTLMGIIGKDLAMAALRQSIIQRLGPVLVDPPVNKYLYTITADILTIKNITDYYLIVKILKEHQNNDNITTVLLYLHDSGYYEGATAMALYLKDYPKKVVIMNGVLGSMAGRDTVLNVQQLAECFKDTANAFDDYRKAAAPFPQTKSKYHK